MGRLINRGGGIISGGLISGICNIFVSKEMDLDPGEGLKPEGCFNVGFLAIIPRVRMGSESIAHEAEGRMGY